MEDKNTTAINVAYPDVSELHLTINVGACRLKIMPGEGGAWVTGTYEDPSGALPSKIAREGGRVRISHEPNWSSISGLFGGTPTFDLALGKEKPYMLTIESGASENIFDIGGLPLTRLQVKQGAGKLSIDISVPNPQEMSLFALSAGASSVEMKNLANLNFAEMVIEGGAASYKLDFGGTLQRNGHARITAGVSSVDIHIPATTAAKITTESPLGSLNVGDGFTKKEGAFWTKAALEGSTPVLTIYASVALGALNIRAT